MGVTMKQIALIEKVEHRIFLIRGQKVMLSPDLATLYGVPTKRLNEQVRRNITRFPSDFMFQLTWEESEELSRSQIATLKRGRNVKYLPYVFTEQGVAMLSSVLNEGAYHSQDSCPEAGRIGAQVRGARSGDSSVVRGDPAAHGTV